MSMKIEAITAQGTSPMVLVGPKLIGIKVTIAGKVYSLCEREGELCISMDGQLAIKPVSANRVAISVGVIGG